MNISAVNNEN